MQTVWKVQDKEQMNFLHVWNARVQRILESTHRKSWGQTALCHHGKLMDDIANLPPTRSAKRALELQPRAKKMGRTRVSE